MLTIYKASAGSGKTFQLARKYLQLILGYYNPQTDTWKLRNLRGDEHRSILAITFTNKATAEMKRRIIEELVFLASPSLIKKSKHLDYLSKFFNASERELAETAKSALVNLLTTFQNFNVNTIDSFFQSVLRIFAHELDLDDNYDLNLDDREIIELSVEDLLDTVNGSSALLDKAPSRKEVAEITRWIKLYMQHRLREGLNFNVFNRKGKIREDVVGYITKMLNEDFRENSEKIIEWCNRKEKLFLLEKECKESYFSIRQNLRTKALELHRKLENLALSFNEKTVKKEAFAFLNSFISKSGKLPDIYEKKSPSSFLEGKNEAFFYSSIIKKHPSLEIFDDVRSFVSDVFSTYDQLRFLDIIRQNIYFLGIFSEVIRRIQGIRKKEGIFLLSDTNSFLQKIINNDDSPFLYERLGNKLKHYLLDEFQDTSRLQWTNLRPLLIESLSTKEDNFIIGDEKQCIYRFRNSDPKLINSIVKKDLEYLGSTEEKGSSLEENTNWRSLPNIVKFNNTFFLAIAQILDLKNFYSNTIQKAALEKNLGEGYVDIQFLKDSRNNKDEIEYDFQFPDIWDTDNFSENLTTKIALDRMATAIERQLLDGYRPCDIAVLVRTNRDGSLVIRYLLETIRNMKIERKPDVVSGDSLTLNESPAVKYVISQLRLLTIPQFTSDENTGSDTDNESRKFFEKQRRVENLENNFNVYNIAQAENNDSAASLALKRAVMTDMSHDEGTEENLNRASFNPVSNSLSNICENIISFYIKEASKESGNLISQNENVYIATFLDKVLEREGICGSNIAAFLEWWDEKGFQTPVGMTPNPNAITVLTIHKSKGLEYDCVHVPLVKYTLNSSLDKKVMTWFDTSHVNSLCNFDFPSLIPLPFTKAVLETSPFALQAKDILYNDNLDAVNLLYVAFTRAAKELVATIIGPFQGDLTTSKSTIATPAYMAANSVIDLRQLIPDNDPQSEEKLKWLIPLNEHIKDDRIIFGNTTRATIAHAKDPQKEAPLNVEADLQDADSINSVENINLINSKPVKDITEVTRALSTHALDWNDAAMRGIFLHDILRDVGTWEDLEFAVMKCAYKWSVSGERISEVIQILNKAFEKLKFKRWFTDFSFLLNEIPVYQFLEDKDENQSRPDRVIFYKDGSVDVIDYKFGVPDKKAHLLQVKKYVEFFRENGYDKTRGYLWYPLRNLVIQADD